MFASLMLITLTLFQITLQQFSTRLSLQQASQSKLLGREAMIRREFPRAVSDERFAQQAV